jgi:Family of unknown function (DUF5681)
MDQGRMMKKKHEVPNSVGYKNPPQHTQFKPGQSGNPKGRPKKSASLTEVIGKEVGRRVQIVINGKRQKVSMLEAIVKQHLTKAAGGDPKSVAILFSLLKEIQPGTKNKLSELVQEFRAIHDRNTTFELGRSELKRQERKADDETDSPTPEFSGEGA